MIVYFVFAVLLIAINLFLYFFKVSKKRIIISNAVLLILISSLRSVNIGTDTVAYSGMFEYFGELPLNAPIASHLEGFFGYRVICKIVYFISGGNYQIMLFVCSVIIIYGLFKYIYYYSDNATASIFYYITLFYFFFSWNAVRQSMAMSVLLLAIIAFDEKKYIKFVLLSAFAISLHNAVAVLFVCFVIKKIRWNKGLFAGYVFVLIAGMLMVENIILLFFKIFPRYASVYLNTLTTGSIAMFGGEAKGRKIILSLIFLFFIIYAFLVLKKEKFEPFERTGSEIAVKNESLWFFSALTIIEVVIGVLYSKNTMYLRVQSFISFFAIFLLPAVIERTNKKYKNIIYIATNIIFAVATIIRMVGGESDVYPYEFCF